MKYSINRTKRNSIILSSLVLILYVFIVRLYFFFKNPTPIDTLQSVIQSIIFIIPYGYLMLQFIEYFRHYKLKVLQISILTIFMADVILRANLFTNLVDSTWKQAVLASVITIWIIATISLIVFLFQIKMQDYPGILSIRKYAIFSLLIFVLVPTVPFFVKSANSFATQQLAELTSAIPSIFTIDFAIKLYLKE